MNPKEWFVTHFVLSLFFSIHHLALNMLTTSHLQSLQKIIISNLKIILYQPNKVVFKVKAYYPRKVEWICTVSLRLVEWFSPYLQTLLNKYAKIHAKNSVSIYSFQNIVSTKTQQGMFRVTRNLLGYSQKNLPVGDLFLRSRIIKMERTYKKA